MTDEATCPHCGRATPPGAYCGACGASRRTVGPPGAARTHAFAANPSEHVLQPSVVSTFFPHVPQGRSVRFRLALLVLVVLLLVVGYLRLTGPSVAIASAAVPLLYLVYLYEVDVYVTEPLYVIGVTFGVGFILGAVWALLTGRFITQTVVLNATLQGSPVWRILVIAVAFPLVAQVLMLIGALILRYTRRYDEVLDGFTAGAASALGFVFALTLISLFPEVQSGPISVAAEVSSAIRAVLHGLLIPFIDAGLTGLIAASLWLHRERMRAVPRYGWTTSLLLAVAVAAVVQVALGLAGLYAVRPATTILIYGGVTVALILWLRVALHFMLLTEVVDPSIGPEAPCLHCERMVPRMPFCPECGGAARAMPKTGSGGDGRAVR